MILFFMYTLGKFIALKGTVARVGAVKPFCTKLAFTCTSCGNVFAIGLPDGRFVTPSICTFPGCQSYAFTPNRTHRLTQTIDWQQIRLQGNTSHGSNTLVIHFKVLLCV